MYYMLFYLNTNFITLLKFYQDNLFYKKKKQIS